MKVIHTLRKCRNVPSGNRPLGTFLHHDGYPFFRMVHFCTMQPVIGVKTKACGELAVADKDAKVILASGWYSSALPDGTVLHHREKNIEKTELYSSDTAGAHPPKVILASGWYSSAPSQLLRACQNAFDIMSMVLQGVCMAPTTRMQKVAS